MWLGVGVLDRTGGSDYAVETFTNSSVCKFASFLHLNH
jgi:hypothetical protein